jgi:hypothetical protein
MADGILPLVRREGFGAVVAVSLLFAPGCGETSSVDEPDMSDTSAPCPGGCQDEESLPPRPLPLPRPECPASEPRAGDVCTVVTSRLCTYGESDSVNCRRQLECADGTWTVPAILAGLSCSTVDEPACPADIPDGRECRVRLDPFTCRYAHGLTCYCGDDRPVATGSPSTWFCYGPPKDRRCPERLPNLGEGCAEAGVECSYTPLPCQATTNYIKCVSGVWVENGTPPCDL